MPQGPPFRQRPTLHLNVRTPNSSPLHHASSRSGSLHNELPTPTSTPLATTAYSPFRSAGLKPPTPSPSQNEMSPKTRRQFRHGRSSCACLRSRRLLISKSTWILALALLVLFWGSQGGIGNIERLQSNASGFAKEHLQGTRLTHHQFFPASNPKIHYTGRWTATPNQLRKDGNFPGVYLDVIVTNTSAFILALHNRNHVTSDAVNATDRLPSPNPAHFSFRPASSDSKPAKPISLLARVDDDEYILLPNASSLATICLDTLNPQREHRIRVVAPMTDNLGRGVLELEGVWLSKGGKLLRVPGSHLNEEYANEDLFDAENDFVGERHKAGLKEINDQSDGQPRIPDQQIEVASTRTALQNRKRVLEIVTDSPGSLTKNHDGAPSRTADRLLSGVMGWEYVLGEMFDADHVGIGVDGMCLVQDCIGGLGSPAGLGDVFFRSGPYGSDYFGHSWDFSGYVPDLVILNLGSADHASFDEHHAQYNKTFFDLSARFESTYVSLIKGIRRLAYPKHPTVLHSERLNAPGAVPPSTPAAIPIFVMRPLRGELEQSTQNVVTRLRADGDKSVFWLDTSGWLDLEDEAGDFYFDESDPTDQQSSAPMTHSVADKKWRLTRQGNQRVAIFLHMHVCRYLAATDDKCAFLPHEVYQGKVFDPEEANFNRYLENEKERRLRTLFWDDDAASQKKLKTVPAATNQAGLELQGDAGTMNDPSPTSLPTSTVS